MSETYILTFTSADRTGIIHAITGALLDVGGNILEQAQFTDAESGVFCLRTRFEATVTDVAAVRAAITAKTAEFEPIISVRAERARRRVMIMVSRQDHCLVDLLYRHDTGELAVDIPLVVSNHETCRDVVLSHGISFVHLPVTGETRRSQEVRLLELVAEHDIDVVVLARYMQILSADVCSQLPSRIINIHHSFLPGFKGARPYHQAYVRGVKLIGATAHFVTADLDDGPIIEQQVERVSHAHTPDMLAEIGRDVERLVLSRAVRLFAEDRILQTGRRTVVFA